MKSDTFQNETYLNLENYLLYDDNNEYYNFDYFYSNNHCSSFLKPFFSTEESSGKLYGNIMKKRGRKKKDEYNDNNILHSKYDNDNIIYKLKVNCMRNILFLLNDLILQKFHQPTLKLQKIDGGLIKDGKKISNLIFFQSKIKDILLMKRTRKIKKKRVIENKEVIKKIEDDKDELLNEILNYEFNNYLQSIYIRLNNEEFKQKFKVKSNYLFVNLTIDEKQKKIMKKIVENDLINYYNNIQERRTKKNKKINNYE